MCVLEAYDELNVLLTSNPLETPAEDLVYFNKTFSSRIDLYNSIILRNFRLIHLKPIWVGMSLVYSIAYTTTNCQYITLDTQVDGLIWRYLKSVPKPCVAYANILFNEWYTTMTLISPVPPNGHYLKLLVGQSFHIDMSAGKQCTVNWKKIQLL